jgi:hypothetical protein
LQQFCFYSQWRALALKTAGERLQPFRQLMLFIQAPGAPKAVAGVVQSLELLCWVSHPTADKLVNRTFEVFAFHAKHLLLSMASWAGSTFTPPLSFWRSKARPRCKRDRTVPTEQPRADAVSS